MASSRKKATDHKALLLLAEKGDADAQFKLGNLYSDGDGVPQDDEKAVAWYLQSAEQGHADAQLSMGDM